MANLELRSRRDDQLAQFADGQYTVRGEEQWLLTGPKEALDTAASGIAGIGERLADGLMLLDFGNAVGLFEVPGLGRVEVVSGKWTRAHFDRMVAELTEIASALPFTAGAGAALPYDHSVVARDDVLYHMFVYLRWVLSGAPAPDDQLLPMLTLILHEPYRQFVEIRREVPLDQVRRIDSSGLSKLVTGYGGFVRVRSATQARSALANALHGHLPEHIDERHLQVTMDTPENRFVKAFLTSIAGVIQGIRQHAEQGSTGDVFSRRLVDDCNRMASVLQPIRQHAMWRDVGPMVHLPASSTVLQRRQGYRQVYRHFARARLAARVPLAPRLVQDLIEAKNVATLYEIWCFFRLVQELSSLLGPPASADRPRRTPFEIVVPWHLSVVWSNGTRLLFNPSFSRSRRHRYSYSVPLRPDIALRVPRGPNQGLHLLDAKFKVQRLGTALWSEADNDEESVSETSMGTFKRPDLYKMHAYRDAIPSARSVWILYPGNAVCFFSEGGAQFRHEASLTATVLDGVGAIPLAPDDRSSNALRTILRALIGEVPQVSERSSEID